MGYHVLEKEGYEADDILGTLADLCEQNEIDAYVMTGDRDSLQLISTGTHVLLATNTETVEMDEAKFLEKYGVPSSSFVDVKALMGDSSDNIPGVPGIGEKTALKLIAEYGSLDGVYEALPTAKHTPSVRAKLENGRESAYLSRDLARINRAVPMGLTPADLVNEGIRRADARRLFLRLEFSAFLKRFDLDQEDADEAVTASPTVTPQILSPEELCAKLTAETLLGFDESEGEIRFSNGTELWSCVAPIADFYAVLQEITLVCYDSKQLCKCHREPEFRALDWFDVMLGAYLVNSQKNNYELSTLASDYLGELSSDETLRAWTVARLYQPILDKLEESEQLSLL